MCATKRPTQRGKVHARKGRRRQTLGVLDLFFLNFSFLFGRIVCALVYGLPAARSLPLRPPTVRPHAIVCDAASFVIGEKKVYTSPPFWLWAGATAVDT
jgi:hypothetical protein